MNPIKMASEADPAGKQETNFRIFGIGTAGLNVLDQMVREGLDAACLVAVHSDGPVLDSCCAGEKVRFTSRQSGVATGPGSEDGNGSAVDSPAVRLKSLCSGTPVVLVVAGLGGRQGTSVSALVASAARESGAFVIAFVILPFECEGSQRAMIAEGGLGKLKESAHLVIRWPNQKTLGLIDETTSLMDTFKASNQLLGHGITSAVRALRSETAMGLSFLDLCGAIHQESVECLLAIGEATGQNRAGEAMERLMGNPMLSGVDLFRQARVAGVSVLGGTTLGMAELNRIMDLLQRRCHGVPVLMGAAIDADLGDRVRVSLLLALPTGPASSSVPNDGTDREVSPGISEELGVQLLDGQTGNDRRHSRFLPPPPSYPPERMAQILKDQGRGSGRVRKSAKLRQPQLPLEIVSKGRFDKSEPTIHKGEDLDVPTYIRRGVALN